MEALVPKLAKSSAISMPEFPVLTKTDLQCKTIFICYKFFKQIQSPKSNFKQKSEALNYIFLLNLPIARKWY